MLYNSFPYDKDEMNCIETEIMSRIVIVQLCMM